GGSRCAPRTLHPARVTERRGSPSAPSRHGEQGQTFYGRPQPSLEGLGYFFSRMTYPYGAPGPGSQSKKILILSTTPASPRRCRGTVAGGALGLGAVSGSPRKKHGKAYSV